MVHARDDIRNINIPQTLKYQSRCDSDGVWCASRTPNMPRITHSSRWLRSHTIPEPNMRHCKLIYKYKSNRWDFHRIPHATLRHNNVSVNGSMEKMCLLFSMQWATSASDTCRTLRSFSNSRMVDVVSHFSFHSFRGAPRTIPPG